MFVYVSGVFLESFVAFRCVSKNLAVYRFCSKSRTKKKRLISGSLDPEEVKEGSWFVGV